MKSKHESYDRIWGQLRGQGVPGSRIRVGRCSLCLTGWMWDRRAFDTHVDDDGGILILWPQSDDRPHLDQTHLLDVDGSLVAHHACPECHGQRDMGSWITQLRRTTRLANINWMPYAPVTS
jgi:hypothetical protein